MTTEIDNNVEQQTEVDLDAIIRELDAGFDRLPEDALRQCQRHRELVTRRLIEVLQEAVRLGREGTVREGNAHFFALFLLTEFQAKEALPVIVDVFSLKDPVVEDLLDDLVTETPRRVLAVLADDQPELIESMILNNGLNEYIRWESAAALCQLVRDGRMTRQEALERMMRQFRAGVAAKDEWGVTIVACEMGHLNPLEMQHEIKEAFDQGLVAESILDWESFQEYDLRSDQPGQCPALDRWDPSKITDTVEELRGWHWFDEETYRAREALETAPGEFEDEFASDFAALGSLEPDESSLGTIRHDAAHVGRNDPCPCGSGKKFKKCCMRRGYDL